MEYLVDLFNQDHPLWATALVAGIVVASVIIALLFNKLVFPVLLKIAHRLPTSLDSRLLNSARLPMTFGIVLLSIYLSITFFLELTPEQRAFIDRVSALLVMVIGIWLIASVVSQVFRWYMDTVSHRTESRLDERVVPMVRRISVALVYLVGGLLILDQLDINISPLVAGLGLGGLAVALALQPTLSNLFAGTYVMTEGAVTPGDYIELESGVAGYVLDVSWRSTRIRTFYNNLVIVPNARFAETIITNYQEPSPPLNILVMGAVSLDSDLYYVEQVCREVIDEVLENSNYGVKEFGNWFGFENFGESNVEFWLFVQAKDRIASFFLRTELMERLRERFREEGIVINYPVRSLQVSPNVDFRSLVNQQGSARSSTPRPGEGEQRGERRRNPQRSPQPGVHLPPDMGQGPEGGGNGPGGPGAPGGPV